MAYNQGTGLTAARCHAPEGRRALACPVLNAMRRSPLAPLWRTNMFDILLNITYLAAIAMSLYSAVWLLLKADRNRTVCAFIACQLLIVVWCVPQLFLGFVQSREGLYTAYAISYVGICFIGPAWLVFALWYAGKRLPLWGMVLLWALPAVNFAVLLTNEVHHLFYTEFEVGNVVYGPAFLLHVVFTYACVVAGMAAVAGNFRKYKVRALHIAMILVSAAVPLLFNLLHISGAVQTGFDLTPPAFSVSSLIMLLAVYRYDFLDVNSLAFGQILEELPEAVLVYNERGRVTWANTAAQAWFGVKSGDGMGRFEAAVAEMDRLEEPPEGPQEDGDESQAARQRLLVRCGDRRLEIRRRSSLDRNGHFQAGTVLVSDVSRYYELLDRERELAVQGGRLAVEQERNRIAQEVHDTTGHTLTMINSLLKLARIGRKDKTEAETDAYLLQAEELAAGGIRELRCSINNLRAMAQGGLVSQGVRQLAGSIREFQVEVTVQGTDSPRYSRLSPVILQCFKEALTNCMKYAQATHMDAILKFSGDSLAFYIFDNGRGCGQIRRGNGLEGIYRRVEEAGGQVRVASEEGDGFRITIHLPVEPEGKTG